MTVFTKSDYMSQVVRIEVRLPDGHWAGEATRESPSSTLQIIETMPLGKGRGTAQISTDELLLNRLEHLSGVESVNLLDVNKATVTIASGGGGFIKALRVVGVVPRTPFEVIDGWADWTIQCSSSQAKQLIEEINSDEIPMRLKSTRSSNDKLLTTRQTQIFELAKRKGYWNIPREISITQLAEITSSSKSTISVMLHAIESKIVDTFYDEII